MDRRNIAIFLVIFLAGMGVGVFVAPFVPKNTSEDSGSKQVRQFGQYSYINPLLECEVADGVIDARKENFHGDLEEFIADLQKKRGLSDVALYFRDLNNGPAFGIHQEDGFFPASLLKVPVMMAYYHLAEQNPSLLNEEVLFEAPLDLGFVPTIVPRESLHAGTQYTIDQLIEHMIIYSDNQALYLLSQRLPPQEVQNLFEMIGADPAVLKDAKAQLTVKEYSGFFRILFNSSYLSRDYSEKALKLLASTDYHDALPAGVPEGVSVAHKFGEAGTGNIERQLHDCGIVYFPGHPYLACVMTRGHDTETLKNSITDISRFIYQKIGEQY